MSSKPFEIFPTHECSFDIEKTTPRGDMVELLFLEMTREK